MMLKRENFLAAALFVALSTGTAPVFAGFEWKPPAGTSAPAAAVDSPAMPAQKVQAIESAPLLTEAERKKMPAPAAASEVISGFGTDLPLTVALQQVVPPEYKVSLAAGVNPDTSVSWQGDKPWKQTLADMLSAQGLGSSFQGDAVVVGPLADAAHPVKAAAPSKADMIPADMISDNAKSSSPAPVVAKETAAEETAAEPVTIHSDKPVPEKMLPQAEEKPVVPEPAVEAAPQTVADATPPAASSPAPAVESTWQAAKGQTLRDVLNDWSKIAHVELYWSIDYDYRLKDTVAYTGSFDTAVGKLFDQFARARPQPYGSLHKAADGGGVLVVNTYDNPN